MISPIVATQNSAPIAAIQQNTDSQGVIQTQMAHVKVQEQERVEKETVIKKDEAVFYEQHHDAKEEGKNKYMNLYGKGKKKKEDAGETRENHDGNRINFDITI